VAVSSPNRDPFTASLSMTMGLPSTGWDLTRRTLITTVS
jgi:enediyne biosynthesis protein E4